MAKYNKEIPGKVYKLCLLGLTDVQMCSILEISEATFSNWKKKYPDFFASIKKGKEIADAEVAVSLNKRAKGFTKKITEQIVVKDQVIEIERKTYYPPDTTACIYWLKNRQPAIWRDKKEVEAEVTSRPSPSEFLKKLLE